MDSMLAKFSCAVAYFNDIIIVNKSAEEHQQHLCAVGKAISLYVFKLNGKKFLLQIRNHVPGSGQDAKSNRSTFFSQLSLRSYLCMVNFYQLSPATLEEVVSFSQQRAFLSTVSNVLMFKNGWWFQKEISTMFSISFIKDILEFVE
uniref:Uncharacterized protein n=1 Tax=Ditylenchus dipsaci TaxID=166011 RepID=A0A915ENX1_9BILA